METERHYLQNGDKISTGICILEYDEAKNTFVYKYWEYDAYGPNGCMLQWDDEKEKYYEEF